MLPRLNKVPSTENIAFSFTSIYLEVCSGKWENSNKHEWSIFIFVWSAARHIHWNNRKCEHMTQYKYHKVDLITQCGCCFTDLVCVYHHGHQGSAENTSCFIFLFSSNNFMYHDLFSLVKPVNLAALLDKAMVKASSSLLLTAWLTSLTAWITINKQIIK